METQTAIPLIIWHECSVADGAGSDRGWAHYLNHPDTRDGYLSDCVGNYIDYSAFPHAHPDGRPISAQSYIFAPGPAGVHCLGSEHRWLASIPEAKAWIEERARELVTLVE